MQNLDFIANHPPTQPTMRLLWTAIVDVGDRVDLGKSAVGQRLMVPILGGHFYSGPGIESLSGKVLPGGTDRQWVRADGIKELDALYEMQTDDRSVPKIRNRDIVDEARQPERYAKSVIKVTAPIGPFEWLNRRLIVGTLQSTRPERSALLVRAWEADAA